MLTRNQLVMHSRKRVRYHSKTPALHQNPQKRAEIVKIFTRSPKKPNSAVRKVVKVKIFYYLRISKNKIKKHSIQVEAYVPGEGHSLKVQGAVLLHGGRVPDLPGVRYHLIRGKFSFTGILSRRTARSLYGAKRPVKEKKNKL